MHYLFPNGGSIIVGARKKNRNSQSYLVNQMEISYKCGLFISERRKYRLGFLGLRESTPRRRRPPSSSTTKKGGEGMKEMPTCVRVCYYKAKSVYGIHHHFKTKSRFSPSLSLFAVNEDSPSPLDALS